MFLWLPFRRRLYNLPYVIFSAGPCEPRQISSSFDVATLFNLSRHGGGSTRSKSSQYTLTIVPMQPTLSKGVRVCRFKVRTDRIMRKASTVARVIVDTPVRQAIKDLERE